MFEAIRRNLSFANVVAVLALCIALGGSATAVTITGRGKVTGNQIQNSSVTGKDVKNESLTGLDVLNGSLFATDFAAGQIPAGEQGAQGPQGPQGDQGPKGDKGDQGDPGPSTIASGETVSGYYFAGGTAADANSFSTSNFYFPLDAPGGTTLEFVGKSAAVTANCPLIGEAAPGFLCIYERQDVNQDSRFFFNIPDPVGGEGFQVRSNALAAGDYLDAGVWAYHAP